MNGADRLERDLTDWFAETAAPSVPAYTDEIVRVATRTRQRPAWASTERWRPIRAIRPRTRGLRGAWSAVALLLVVLALLLAVAALIGSRPRLPAPFGLAENGLLAFARDGDIFTFDPVTEETRVVVTGPDEDHDPRWSLDGRRIAFARGSNDPQIAFVNPDGSHLVVADEIQAIDTDSIAWAPDGQRIAVAGRSEAGRGIFLVDAATGRVRPLDVAYTEYELFWRPSRPNELLYKGPTPQGAGLFVVDTETGQSEELKITGDPDDLRPIGWTWDGQRVLYQPGFIAAEVVRVRDLVTAMEQPLEVAFGHLANGGRHVVGVDTSTTSYACVVSIEGGPCKRISTDGQKPAMSTAAALTWSPNDAWIVTYVEETGLVWLLSQVEGVDDISIEADGPASFQRTAP